MSAKKESRSKKSRQKGMPLSSIFADDSTRANVEALVREDNPDAALIAAIMDELWNGAKANAKRQQQSRENLPGAEQRKYDAQERAAWKKIAQEPNVANRSKANQARIIAERRGLSDKAVETIRKVI